MNSRPVDGSLRGQPRGASRYLESDRAGEHPNPTSLPFSGGSRGRPGRLFRYDERRAVDTTLAAYRADVAGRACGMVRRRPSGDLDCLPCDLGRDLPVPRLAVPPGLGAQMCRYAGDPLGQFGPAVGVGRGAETGCCERRFVRATLVELSSALTQGWMGTRLGSEGWRRRVAAFLVGHGAVQPANSVRRPKSAFNLRVTGDVTDGSARADIGAPQADPPRSNQHRNGAADTRWTVYTRLRIRTLGVRIPSGAPSEICHSLDHRVTSFVRCSRGGQF